VTDTATTPSAVTADEATASQDNDWAARYTGLQKVIAKRDTELHTAREQFDSLRAEHEALLSELNEYRQSKVDAEEEEQARKQYDALRARFEPEPPTPIANNPRGEWFNPERRTRPQIELDDTQSLGWPI